MGACRRMPAQRSPAVMGQGNGAAACAPPRAQADCLEQLLEAFRDILDRDDIHQAARRLALVQQWIRDETAAAAADPIFADLPTG